jgi:hypothetical protein
MSYYLFPKANSGDIHIQLHPSSNKLSIQRNPLSIETLTEFSHSMINSVKQNIDTSMSPSLTRYLDELFEIIQKNPIEYEYIQNEIHTYYKNVLANGPDNSYYEITEIMHTMRINYYLDCYVSKNIQILNLGSNSNAILHSRKGLNRNDINNCDLSIFQFSNLFQKMHIIFAENMNDSKNMIIRLCTILAYQAKNGVLLWKIGDCFTPLTVDIIYFLSSFYHKTYFIKPIVMDSSKPEKYIVCKGFCPSVNYMEKIMSLYNVVYKITEPIYRILSISIPYFFLNKLEEINYIFGQSQLEQIHTILLLVGHKYKHDKLNTYYKINTQKSKEWLNKYNISFITSVT